jgi:nicotinamide mononucleotide transporter
MPAETFGTPFLQQLKATPFAEWVAFIFGVLQVALALANRRLNFVAGLISVGLYTVLFYEAGLFAESILNAYYVVISIAGWVAWSGSGQAPAITRCSGKEQLQALVLSLLAWGILYGVLLRFTSSTVPATDALVTALAWAGSWLLMRRKLENWLWLNASNVVAITLQLSKGMALTSVLTLIYFVMALAGYWQWRREIRNAGFHSSL